MIKIFTVDAFTDDAFNGNPAAVCLPDFPLDEKMMQNIAFEMNLSETAFVFKSNGAFNLRWFTPECEVDLCGHATLASAHILWQEKFLAKNEPAVFQTLYKGILKANFNDPHITLDFPVNVPVKCKDIPKLNHALGVAPKTLLETEHHYLAELNSEEEVINATPDFESLKNLSKYGIIITSVSDTDSFDFISRFFAPKKGINEDPVTGSAHCVLAPYWSEKLGKSSLSAYQASKRGGALKIALKKDRVLISGKAVTIISGILNL
ncbi:MAG: putative isomerase YddE [Ignavibacteria bacterium]|nr:putative isomerase YddE [Ignavibacteria bacterium]